MKKLAILLSIAALATAALTGCGNDSKTESSAATADEASYAQAATVATLGETDQAVVDAGLSVDSKGNVVDKNGNKVKQTADGKVEVKTADGKTVTVNAAEIKTANENKSKVDTANQAAEGQKTANNANTSGNSSAQASQTNQTKQSSQTSQASTSNQSNQTSKPAQGSQTSHAQQSSQAQSTTVDPHAGKTYHEAVYKTVNHPAETKQVKVVDQEAYSYEEPVYETKRIHKCKDCGIDLLQLTEDEEYEHSKAHVLAGGDGGWYSTTEEVQVGTRTVNVPEQSHMETVVVKEAWTEQVIVKKADWY